MPKRTSGRAAKGILMMRINWLLLPLAFCVLLACHTSRSYAGYVVTDIKHVAMTANEIYGKTGERLCNGNERCIFMEVTLLHDGHTIKAVCQLFDPLNACDQIEVGKSYGFTRRRGSMDFLSLENPQIVLTVEEEHDNSR